MVKIVAQQLLKKGDSEDLRTITKYHFSWHTNETLYVYTCTGQKEELGNKYK